MKRKLREIPYPAVFRDWQHPEQRVSAFQDKAGVGVSIYLGNHIWKEVVLTEDDACLYAAKLLSLAGEKKLSKRVLSR